MDKKKFRTYAFALITCGLVFLSLAFLLHNDFIEKFRYVIGFVGLSYVFTGFTFFSSHHPIEKRQIIAKRILIAGLILISIGIILRLLHLNGAGIALIIGFFLIAFTYAPILGNIRIEKWKAYTRKKWHTYLLGFGDIASMGALVIGVLGKLLHWPYTDFLLISGSIVLAASLLAWNKIFSTEVVLRKEAEEKVKLAFDELQTQHKVIEEKNKEILDSLNYAKRIQNALLASDTLLKSNLNDHFVFFKPKDVVSGDFYWATPTTNGFVYITADCTGHGVPGAFMSLLNISKLSETINEKTITRPDLILNNVRSEIIKALNPEGSTEESKDGMDCVLCKIDFMNKKLEYAAANNSFYIIRNNELMVCKADKMPVGKSHDDNQLFTYNEVQLQSGDMVYTFTDGYADQFGGPKGKKFKYKQLEELLISIAKSETKTQKQKLEQAFLSWKGELEQIDDVCIIGVRIS